MTRENYNQLELQMEKLVRMRDDVVSTGKRGKDRWINDVNEIENQFLEFVKEDDSIPKKFRNVPSVNKKLLEFLKHVLDLQEKVNEDSAEVVLALRELDTVTPRRFCEGDLASFTSHFSDKNKIGNGGFGNVYEGKLDSGKKVAVKVLIENSTVEQSFVAEVSTISSARHRSLVKLYGFCFDRNMKALVYEYMENKSLDQILYGNPRGLDWERFYTIAIETGRGLAYLHEGCDKQIIHLDIKPANVLLSATYLPKLTDFGLAKLVDCSVTHVTLSRPGGTPGFVAPELWRGSRATCKSDVYSFGMLLFEILGRRRISEPLGKEDEGFAEEVWEMFQNEKLDKLVKDCGIEENSRENARRVAMVALFCIQWNPRSRPSMSTVVKMLQKEMNVPVLSQNPFHPSAGPSMPRTEDVYSEVTPSRVSESLVEGKFSEKVTPYSSNAQKSQENVYSVGTPAWFSARSNAQKAMVYSVGTPAWFDARARGSDSLLTSFEIKCPPDGENSVIVYRTSLQITGAYYRCQEVVSMLRAHPVEVLERDLYVDSKYQGELMKLLGRIEIPALFVKGRYIGGAPKVRKMDEEGTLSVLLDGVKKKSGWK